MKMYSLKTFLLHAVIFTVYIGITSYFFVVAEQPDPIGTGLRQWVCIFVHFTVTFFIMVGYLGKGASRKKALAKLFLHLTVIVLLVCSLLLFGDPIWKWLWSLR